MRLRTGIWAVCLAATVASGCTKDAADSTLLVVNVTGTVTGIRQLKVYLTDGTQGGTLNVPATPTAITLPTSFSVQFNHKPSPAVMVHVDALDAADAIIASGAKTVAVVEGKTTEIEVNLSEKADAGADVRPDGTVGPEAADVGPEAAEAPPADAPLETPDAADDAEDTSGGGESVDAATDPAVDPAAEPAGETAGLPNGSSCGSAGVCTSGFCVDGVCCDVACTDACMACVVGMTGLSSGACHPITAGTSDSRCAATLASACGNDGKCDGTGACTLWPAATVCVPEGCSAGLHQPQRVCNGTGTCVAASATSCSPFACDTTTCRSTCSNSTHCATGFWCNGASCDATKSDGTACTQDEECSNGHCVDSVCCNTGCTAACNSCLDSLTGAGDGTCSPIVAGTADGRCAASAPTSCGLDGFCDTGGLCRKWSATTTCVPESCTGTTHQPARHCDGAGTCVAEATNDCGLYACGSPTCNNTCSSSADCSGTGYCQGPSCVAKKGDGSACGANEECSNGHCIAGFCCAAATGAGSCPGACEVCSGAAGACQNVAAGDNPKAACTGAYVCGGASGCATTCTGTDDTPCAANHYCVGGVCQPKVADGGGCAGNRECSNGHCIAGFCCAAATGAGSCPGTCEVCSGPSGACRPAAAQTDPKAACLSTYICNGSATSCATSCGSDADCAGGRTCALDGTCVMAVKVNPATGDDTGACGTGADPDCKSLTHALVQNPSAKAFVLAAGAYGADETFPITIAGVAVVGPATAVLTATSNVSTLIQATGAPVRLTGIILSGGSSTVGACLTVAGVQRIEGVEVRACTDGVLAQGGAPSLSGVIAQVNSNGIHVAAGKPVLRGCLLGDPSMTDGNTAVGLLIDAGADADLVASGPASNVLRGNAVADLRYSGTATLAATGTTWDSIVASCHADVSAPVSGTDIWVDNVTGSVDYGSGSCP